LSTKASPLPAKEEEKIKTKICFVDYHCCSKIGTYCKAPKKIYCCPAETLASKGKANVC
jgi:hypothetical protein